MNVRVGIHYGEVIKEEDDAIGDVNQDRLINIVDVVLIVNYIFGETPNNQ